MSKTSSRYVVKNNPQFTRQDYASSLERAGKAVAGILVDNKERTGVLCKRCAAPIMVRAPEKVAEEFSVVCHKCNHRAFYHIKDIKTINAR